MLLTIITFLSACATGTSTFHYWDIGKNGFLPINKEESCVNPSMKNFCHILQTNPTTDEIDKAAESIIIGDLFINFIGFQQPYAALVVIKILLEIKPIFPSLSQAQSVISCYFLLIFCKGSPPLDMLLWYWTIVYTSQ